jgi:hypothetical protein
VNGISRSKGRFVMMTSLFDRTMYSASVEWILPSSYQPPRTRRSSGTGWKENSDALIRKRSDCSSRRMLSSGEMSSSISRVQWRAALVRPVLATAGDAILTDIATITGLLARPTMRQRGQRGPDVAAEDTSR